VHPFKRLGKIFQHKILKMLILKGKITKDLAEMLLNWRHSGFDVFCGPRIKPGDEGAMENLSRYIIRVSFSQERMTYISNESKVIYRSEDEKKEKILMPLNGLPPCVLMCRIGENRWFAITAIIVMSAVEKESHKVRITLSPLSWNRMVHLGTLGKTGQGLFRKSMK
jgi:hypothetical protein